MKKVFFCSVLLHFVIGILLFRFQKSYLKDLSPSLLQIKLENLTSSSIQTTKKINLTPTSLNKKILFSSLHSNTTQSKNSTHTNLDKIQNSEISNLIFTNSKVTNTFDQLAEKINFYIDYPQMLIENDVQGSATLDLYFDHNGDVDENKSKIFGSHRLLRGLLTKASRFGLEKWYLSDALKLQKSEFRDQHFQARFEMSYAQEATSKLEKSGLDQYTILRRHFVYPCANPLGVDVACAAIKTAALLKKQFSQKYKNDYDTLKETLINFDEIGLSGINSKIHGV